MQAIDGVLVRSFTPLAVAILLNGLDDLVIDAAWAWFWLKAKLRPAARLFPPGSRHLDSAPRRRIAVLVPLWREHEVAARMLEHNLAAIRYPEYHIFAGAYPNDPETQAAGALSCGPLPERAPRTVSPRRTDLESRLPELGVPASDPL